MANIEKIVLPDNTEYDVKDANALPKTAGADEPVTGDILLDNNNTHVGLIHPVESGCSFNACDAQGNFVCGVFANKSNGSVYLYSNNYPVVLRPNGAASTTGQAYVHAGGDFFVSGDVHRTPKVYSDRVNNKSLTASNQKVVGITGVEAGTYLIVANYNLSLTSSSTTHIYTNIYKSTGASNTIMYSGHAVNKSSDWFNDVAYATFGSGESDVSLYLEPNVSATVTASLFLLRLG